MRCYSVKCNVPGPFVNCCPISEADGFHPDHPGVIVAARAEANLQTVASAVEAAFSHLEGVTLHPAYAWPDGSLYYYAAKDGELSITDLPEDVRDLIAVIVEIPCGVAKY